MALSTSDGGWFPGLSQEFKPLWSVIGRIVAALRPEEIWLFGSRVSGTSRAESDWDLLAVISDGTDPSRLDPIAAWAIVRGSAVAVDLVPCTRSEFEEEKNEIDSLPRAAWTKGVCVFMSVEKRISAYLDLCAQDLDAAEVLARAGNRYSAYHCQQAVEKLLKAGPEHRLAVLVGRLGEAHPWTSLIRPFEKLTPFATTFRYPTPGGRIPAAPSPESVLEDVASLRSLLAQARSELLLGGPG